MRLFSLSVLIVLSSLYTFLFLTKHSRVKTLLPPATELDRSSIKLNVKLWLLIFLFVSIQKLQFEYCLKDNIILNATP